MIIIEERGKGREKEREGRGRWMGRWSWKRKGREGQVDTVGEGAKEKVD